MEIFSVNDGIMKKWERIAGLAEVPEEAYTPRVRVIHDGSGRSGYSFGVVLNPYRTKRYSIDPERCGLCDAVQRAEINPEFNLFPEKNVLDFVTTINAFPLEKGHSLAITRKERPSYTTQNLNGLACELDEMFALGGETGFRVFHNGRGAGATIFRHEHYQLKNPGFLFEYVGKEYGFENCDAKSLSFAPDVKVISDYPFSHAVFNPSDCERIVHFLEKLHHHKELFSSEGYVPHVLCQGTPGILVVPMQYRDNGIGAGDVAGHVLCSSEEEFQNADYDFCLGRLKERLFDREVVSLTRLL